MTVTRLLAAAVLAGMAALPAAAQQVTLRSHDGTISLTGALASFDGEVLVIDTAIGRLRVDAFQVSCEGDSCPPPEALRQAFRIAGAPGLAGVLLPQLVEAFADSQDMPALREPLDAGATRFVLGEGDRPLAELVSAATDETAAFRAMAAGEAAIAVTARRISDAEAQALRTAGQGDPAVEGREHVLALDGLIAAVAPGNPVGLISIPDLVGVLAGRITSWAQLGGPDLPIAVHLAAPGAGTREAVERMLLAPYGARLAPGIDALPGDAEVADAVAADPAALGIVGSAFLRSARALDLRSECGIVTGPDDFAIRTEEYPLTRRLYLYASGGPTPPQARRLAEFALSPAAQDVIAEAGFVDQSFTARRLDRQGMRLAAALLAQDRDIPASDLRAMVATLIAAERLSVTFRFLPGASLPDPRAEADIRRLADWLAAGNAHGREVLLIGFSDAVGRADLNRTLSLRRATQVRDAIRAALPQDAVDGLTLTPLGYGEMTPVGCNETFEGRLLNRRVEVWLRDPG